MAELYENIDEIDHAVLVAVDTGEYDADISLQELGELAGTLDITIAGEIIQKRPELDRATAIGSGKLEEIKEFAEANDATLILFDHELSPMQLRNIERELDLPVIDRTMLILDIFADRAISREGRLQVELARLRYLLPRLTGLGITLSRLGGGGGGAGIGARRGKGETKLELDKRHIRRKIDALEEQLESLETRREQMRQRRKKDGITTVAIVGYTNVGKSTLLNTLTDAGVLSEDKLFATLDPTARSLELPDGRSVMMIDTVGLIRRLPHHLVEAFKSTLEVAVYADLLLNVCDISSPEAKTQVEVTNELLSSLGATAPVLTVLNKCDLVGELPLSIGGSTALISAKSGHGLPELLEKVAAMLPPSQRRMQLLIPYSKGSLIAEIREEGKIFSQDYQADGTEIDALVDQRVIHKVEQYIV